MPLQVGDKVICKITKEPGKILSQVVNGYGQPVPKYEIMWDNTGRITREHREHLIPQYPTVKP